MATQDVRLIRSPISITGMVLTTISAVVFLVVFLADLLGLHTNPYLGILFFLILPGIFVFGLLLIPFGAWLERRRRDRGQTRGLNHGRLWHRRGSGDRGSALRRTIVRERRFHRSQVECLTVAERALQRVVRLHQQERAIRRRGRRCGAMRDGCGNR